MFHVAVRLHNNLDILTEGNKETQQPFDGELPKFTAQHLGHIGLADAEQARGFDLFQAALFHNRVDLQHQLRFDEMLLGIGKAKVFEDI